MKMIATSVVTLFAAVALANPPAPAAKAGTQTPPPAAAATAATPAPTHAEAGKVDCTKPENNKKDECKTAKKTK